MINRPNITPQTRKGLLIWSILALCIVITPRIVRTLYPGEPITLQITTIKKIRHYKKNERKKTTFFYKARYHTPPTKFNPNEYTLAQWVALGLTEKQALVVLKFCAYPLKSNADLKRIFVIPHALYERIKDSTYFPDNPKETLRFRPFPNRTLHERVNQYAIETIDSIQLVNIKGIGPYWAKMVMQYERSLGGFLKPEQLLEVYKMTPEIYALLVARLDFSKPNIRQISINKATADELKIHPYIDSWQANSIVKIRSQLGGFKSIKELRKSHLINTEDFEKLEPYVSL